MCHDIYRFNVSIIIEFFRRSKSMLENKNNLHLRCQFEHGSGT